MRKIITAATAGLFAVCNLLAQDNQSRNRQENNISQNSFFAEAGGPGIAFSANLDRRFANSRFGWGGRLGIGFVSAYDDYYDPVSMTYHGGDQQSAITVPVQVNYIFGKENSPHSFEVGAGASYVSRKLSILNFYSDVDIERRANFFGTFSFMYRRQPAHGGFSWRAGFTPLYAKSYMQAWAGVSVGYNF